MAQEFWTVLFLAVGSVDHLPVPHWKAVALPALPLPRQRNRFRALLVEKEGLAGKNVHLSFFILRQASCAKETSPKHRRATPVKSQDAIRQATF
jgi:hypothetical protein